MPKPTREQVIANTKMALKRIYEEIKACQPDIDEVIGEFSTESLAVSTLLRVLERKAHAFGIKSLEELDFYDGAIVPEKG